jgi:hypothetical protein
MANKTFTQILRPTAYVLPPVLAAGLCVSVDDRHGQSLDQPHDHHENAPEEPSPRFVTIDSGSSTATVTSYSHFSHQFFGDLIVGHKPWPVQNRPDLVIHLNREEI